METNNWEKFKLLSRKNWIIQWRHKKRTFFEILIPFGFVLFLLLLRYFLPPGVMKPGRVYHDLEPENSLSLRDSNGYYSYSLPETSEFAIKLAYSPSNPVLEELVRKAASLIKYESTIPVEAQESASTLVKHMTETKVFCGVEFPDSWRNLTSLPKELQMRIRFLEQSSDNWMLGKLFADFSMEGPRNFGDDTGGRPPGYYQEGFVAVQSALSRAFIESQPSFSGSSKIFLERYPVQAFTQDPFWTAVGTYIAFMLISSLMSPAMNLVKYVTLEKEQQLKESMKIMGLPNWLHWTSWFCKGLLQFGIVVSFVVLMLKISYPSYSNPDISVAVFPSSNSFLLWLFFMSYSVATIAFCFMFSTIFSKTNTATSWFSIAWILSYIALTYIDYYNISTAVKFLLCLLSNSGMTFGSTIISQFEFLGPGVQFGNLFRPSSSRDQLSLGVIMLMFLVDAVLYMLVALYIEQIKPGEFGMSQPWYFPFTKAFWCPKSHSVGYETMAGGDSTPLPSSSNFEVNPTGHRAGIRIQNLGKVFDGKAAVRGLTLNMYEDQITVLLGHNGAGKTTTMSMLVGMIPPSSGTAIINDKDIMENMSSIRSSMGLCPQHNILFDELTVREHIEFFAGLKGMRGERLQIELRKYLALLEFGDKVDTPSKALSGGMKRKLSVILALCGDSKIVLLDEPTSGMDPSARRALWDLLLSEKAHRTLLLTTHFMDEADVLGDRIAIMSEGELKCVGSPFFLKKRFGVGYRLTCVKAENCEPQKMTELLRRRIPGIQIEEETRTEFNYVLNADYIKDFKNIFKDIEGGSKACGVEGFGVSLTTMEEVFLKVGRDADMQEKDEASTHRRYGSTGRVDTIHLEAGLNQYQHRVGGFRLLLNQFYATLFKRLKFTIHAWKSTLAMFIYPFGFMIFSFITDMSFGSLKFKSSLALTPDLYGDSTVLLESDDPSNPVAQVYKADTRGGSFLELNESLRGYIMRENPNSVVAASITKQNMTAFFDNEAYHSVPLTLNALYNAILRVTCPSCHISLANAPVSLSDNPSSSSLQDKLPDFTFPFSMSAIFAIFTSFFIVFYITERISRSKLLQIVSGIDIFVYWLASFLWDYLFYLVFLGIFMAGVGLNHKPFWSSREMMENMTVLLLLFGWASIPMMYVASFLFRVPNTGVTTLFFFNFLAGVIPGMITGLMSFADLQDHSELTDNFWYKLISTILLVVPNYSLMKGLIYLSINAFLVRGPVYSWKPPGLGQPVLAMALMGVFWFVILFLKEFHIVKFRLPRKRRTSPDYEMDEDVMAERNRIHAMSNSEIRDQNILAKDVTKFYKSFCAVKKVSLAVDPAECFGLLGANGAGKTSIFKMLTGEVGITSGDAFIQGVNLKTGMHRVNKKMSYCPQFDALLGDLTCRETLKIYCLIRGIPRSNIPGIISYLSEELHFTKHLDKATKKCSGGNKRKLSTALALLTNPAVIFLDEPTSGLDAGAKRKMWNNVARVREAGSSIVLTSHSMEECEALCTRLAIMVNGEFKCLGSTQHLKNRFSKGFLLVIKMKKDLSEDEVERIKNFVSKSFDGATMKEHHSEMLSYQIARSDLKWSDMFGRMEENKEALKIEDYSLGQNSLEQVFLFFTKYQAETADPALRDISGR